MLKERFAPLLPLAAQYVAKQEQFILANGVPLTSDQKINAYQIGVQAIDKVRLYKIDVIPPPTQPELRQIVQASHLISSHTIGIAFRYGIYIQTRYWQQRRLVVHELTHTMQYERLGGISPFLEAYLTECLTVGYQQSPLEREARENEQRMNES